MIRFLAIAVFILAGIGAAGAQDLPAPGDTYQFEGQSYTVLGAGTEIMETTATGESLVILIDMAAAVATIVPDAGQVIRLDPAVPMMWVDGVEHRYFAGNSYLQSNGAGSVYAILEYNR